VELRAGGAQIHNRWLADFVSVAPERFVGIMQLPPMSRLDLVLEEIRRGRESGLKAVNFPCPRPDFPMYTDECYEPLWSLCEELDVALVTHGGANLGANAAAGWPLASAIDG